MNSKVIISILNWNNALITIRCIESLRICGYLDNNDILIHVIDNASMEKDFYILNAYLNDKKVSFHVNSFNNGFAAGHNQILRLACDANIEFVWLLNNDTIVQPNTLEKMLHVMANDDRCGASSPFIAYEDTQHVYFLGALQNWRSLSSYWLNAFDYENPDASHIENIWLLGTAILVRTRAIVDVGLLDESLFAYCEDDDFGERLRLKQWRSRIVSDAVVLHGPESLANKRRPAYFYYLTARNHTVFYLKYTPRHYRRLLRFRLIAKSVHRSHLLCQAGEKDLAHAVLVGLQDGLTGIMGEPAPAKPLALWLRVTVVFFGIANRIHGLLQPSQQPI